MAVAFRSASNSGRAAGGNLTATEPAGAAEGDILVAIWEQDNSAVTLGLPAGWTEVQRGNDGSAFAWVVGYIVRGASAPSLTFTASGSQYRECIIVCISGGEFDAVQVATGSASSGNANPPSATASTASDLAVAMVYFWAGYNSPGPTAPSGYTAASSAWGTGGGGGAAYRSLSASGAEDPGVFANGNGTANYVTVTFLAKEPAVSPTEQDSPYTLGRVVTGGARLT